MGIAGDALLLGAAAVDAPFDGMVAEFLVPVIHPLEVIFGFLERAVALVDSERIAVVEPAVAVDVEGGHAAGRYGTGVQAGQSGVEGGRSADAIGLDADAVAIEAETEIGDEGGTEGVIGSDGEALIADERIAGETEGRGSAGDVTEGAGGLFVEIGDRVAGEEMGGLREGVIDAAVVLIDVEHLGERGDVVVVNASAVVGHWEVTEKLLHGLADGGGGEHVDLAISGEDLAAVAGGGVAAIGVEGHAGLGGDLSALGGGYHDGVGAGRSGDGIRTVANIGAELRAEIAGAFGGGGHGGDKRTAVAAAGALIIEKEEDLVFDDGAAEGAAELVPAQGRVEGGEMVGGVEEIVAKEFEEGSVPLVRAGLGGGLEQGAGDGAELGVVVTGGYFEILERVEVRIDDGDAEDGAFVFGAVEEEAVGGEELAVDVDLHAALGILAGGVLPRVHLGAGNDEEEGSEVAVEDGKALDFVAGEGGADVGAVGFEQRRVFGDGDGALSFTDLQERVDAGGGVDFDVGVGGEGGESGRGDLDVVAAGEEMGLGVVAGFIGFRLERNAAIAVGNGDFGPRDGGAGGIGDGADDVAGDGLGAERSGGEVQRHESGGGKNNTGKKCRHNELPKRLRIDGDLVLVYTLDDEYASGKRDLIFRVRGDGVPGGLPGAGWERGGKLHGARGVGGREVPGGDGAGRLRSGG